MSVFLRQGRRGMLAILATVFSLASFISLTSAALNPPNSPNTPSLTPTLSTPTKDPSGSYNSNSNQPVIFTFKLSGFGSNEEANMAYAIMDGLTPAVTSFASVPMNPIGNGTYSVTWNGKLDNGVKPTHGKTYTFQVKGFYGPNNMTALGTKSVSFMIDDVPTALETPTMDPPSPYNNKVNLDGVTFTTVLSNLYDDGEFAHLKATIHKDSVNNAPIATFTSNQKNGPFEVEWKDANAATGDYIFRVEGEYGKDPSLCCYLDPVELPFKVDNTVTAYFDKLTASDNPFNLNEANNTNVFTTQLNSAPNNDITVKAGVYVDDGQKNNPLYSWEDPGEGTGEKKFIWDGKDNDGKFVPSGKYYFSVYGQQGNSILSPASIKFDVIGVGDVPANQPAITSLKATPSTFSPNGDNSNDTTVISFDLNTSASVEISTKVGNNTVILYSASKNAGTTNFTWDGKVGNSVVANGTYTITVKATNIDGSDQETVNVTVNNQAAPSTNCGYPDVTLGVGGITKEICDAFKFTKDRGIFLGDDGTGNVRPFDVINRVEAAAVIMRGYDMPLLAASGGNEGFTDVLLNQWYMKTGVVRSAKQYGVLKGYPDGTLRPAQQVIRAELVVMFVRASGKLPGDVSTAPYADTAVEASTMWYLPSVNSAKIWGWIPSTTNFFPTQGMTRADVAKLFFAAYEAGNAGL